MILAELPKSEAKKEPVLLHTMEYQAEGLGYFPLLAGKVRHLITWGPHSRNMSATIGPDRQFAVERTLQAMKDVGMAALSQTMRIVPTGPRESQILEVTQDKLTSKEEDTETHSNFIYTTDPTIALSVKPGDCTASIIYATLPSGKSVVGLLHAGREQLDENLATQAVQHLVSMGCDAKEIHIGITPSIGFENYYVKTENKDLLTNFAGWQEKGRLREDTDNGRIYLDLLGFCLDQFLDAGVIPQHIQPYAIDTLTAAQQGEGFSQRYASYTNNPSNNGRYLVAAQLEN